MKTALSIAGTDPSGGAGIQADIKTMTMNGVYAMTAITALVVQNTTSVTMVQTVSPSFLCRQIDAVFEDIPPDAVKIGMVASPELARVIAERMQFYGARNLVVDPVMVATCGGSLAEDGVVRAMQDLLFPLAAVITPNIPEAEVLCGRCISSPADMERAARELQARYGCAVLVKGGHDLSDASDLLCALGKLTWFRGEKIDNPNTHGTGCTLSSAIAANLAKGYPLETAIRRAKAYVTGALAAMLRLGHGSGPLDHAFCLTGEFSREAER